MTPHQRAAYERARVVPDDSFLYQPRDDLQQGPELKPRNWLADRVRERGLYGMADRLNDRSSGVGLAADAAGGLLNMLVVEPYQSMNRMLERPMVSGDPRNAEDAMNVAGAAMLGGLAAPRPRNTVGAFGGRLAQTADQQALSRAEDMAGRGVPREQIWNETGWFKGVDGKWRFEIDDPSFGLLPYDSARRTIEGRASDIVEADKLLQAYPQLGKAKISAEIGDTKSLGYGSFVKGDLVAGPSQIRVDDYMPWQADSILAHEMQHGIQYEEGFSRGTSPMFAKLGRMLRGDFSTPGREAYTRAAGEVEARAVQKRMDMTPEQRAARPPWLDYDVPEDQQIVRFYANGGRPGAAMGAVNNLLAGYGYPQPAQPQQRPDWTRNVRPGDI